MAQRVGIIGGTGLYTMPKAEPIEIETPAGPVVAHFHASQGLETFFIPRHGAAHDHVPLRVPHLAHVHAMRSARCDYVIGVHSVGALRKEIPTPSWFVPSDFIDLHRQQRPTLFADQPVHADLSTPYCPHIRRSLQAVAAAQEGVYVGVDGPRFETPAEVRAFAAMGGDVVGMTGVPEAVLMREAGLCYASLSFVANKAAGLSARVDAKKIQAALVRRRNETWRVLQAAIKTLPKRKACDCGKVAATLTQRAVA